MRQVRWANWLGAATLMTVCGTMQPLSAEITSDRAAAILNYPLIEVSSDEDFDTVIQLSNTSEDPVDLHCFYENANSHCTNDGTVCEEASDCCDGTCGICEPGWNETDFRVRLTPRQPLGWLASDGLTEFPIDGVDRTGSDGSSNAGSRIPPVPEDPFIGILKCIVVDEEGTPVDRNVVKGEATLTEFGSGRFDIAKYNAVGLQAVEGGVNDDRTLVLGGDDAEYGGCPNVIIVNHFFDLVDSPADTGEITTELILAPCSQDLLRQQPGSAVVQYLVYNEFEQRFSTSRTVECQQALELSEIDTTQPERSIFSAGVAGTVTGQTRLTPIGDGLVGVAIEDHNGDATAAFNIHYQGDRAEADEIILP